MAANSDILVAVNTANYGSVLVLKSGQEVPINLRRERLNEALIERNLKPLDQILSEKSMIVYPAEFLMTLDEWHMISAIIRMSPDVETTFQGFPSLRQAFSEPYPAIVKKHSRVYGNMTKGIYTFSPIDFHPDSGRGMNWYFGILSYKGGWLIKTRVNLNTEKDEIETEHRPGYFIESLTAHINANGVIQPRGSGLIDMTGGVSSAKTEDTGNKPKWGLFGKK